MISEREVNALVDLPPEAIRFYIKAVFMAAGGGDTGSTYEGLGLAKEDADRLFSPAIVERDGTVHVDGRIGQSMKKAANESILVDVVVKMFNASAPIKVPKIERKSIKAGSKRQSSIVRCFRDFKSIYGLDSRQAALAFGKYFDYCWTSKFLSNETAKQEGRHENFKITFDFLLTPTYFPQICEGKWCEEPFNPREGDSQ